MWTRRELKEQAKDALKRNYWKAVLVTVLFGALLGGTGGAATAGVAVSSGSGSSDTGSAWAFIGGFLHEYFPGLLTTLIILAVVLVILSLAVSILLLNPINVGFSCFRVNALRGTGNVGDLGRGFDAAYKRNVGTLLLQAVYTFLWTCLLIVPGFIKAYEYCMIPYLLADHPEMTRQEAFATSKAMMKGNKWKAFVLDLSFIPWDILSALTLGIVSVFYVAPYRQLTAAALYEKLKAQNEVPAAEVPAQGE